MSSSNNINRNKPSSKSKRLPEVTVPSHINPYISTSSATTMYNTNNMAVYNQSNYYNQYNNYNMVSSYSTPTTSISSSSSSTNKGKQKLSIETTDYQPYSKKARRHRKQPHELLTEEQKKANHIASEQKRRQNIKIGLDQLIDVVPTLNHGNKSEALILQKSVDHIRNLIEQKKQLKNQVRNLQDTLGEANLEKDSSEDEMVYF